MPLLRFQILIRVLALAILSGASASAAELEVEVLGADARGVVFVALFDTSDAYEENRPIGDRETSATGKAVKVSFENLAPGDYGIKVFHDRNSNGEIDTGFFGIPKEPYGFSNDARGRMGPPDFDQVRFSVEDEKTSIQVHLQ